MTDRELMQQALDSYNKFDYSKFPTVKALENAMDALRARLAQPEPTQVIQARREGNLIVVDLPDVPMGGGGICKDAQPESEPVAKPVGCVQEVHTNHSWGGSVGVEPKLYGRLPVGTLLYTSPPRKEWQGLTDEEIKDILDCGRGGIVDIKKAEQKLKEKNQ